MLYVYENFLIQEAARFTEGILWLGTKCNILRSLRFDVC